MCVEVNCDIASSQLFLTYKRQIHMFSSKCAALLTDGWLIVSIPSAASPAGAGLASACLSGFPVLVTWSVLSGPQGLHAFSVGLILKCDLFLSSLGDNSCSLCPAN